jgi:hypothetical protein
MNLFGRALWGTETDVRCERVLGFVIVKPVSTINM